ncbi:MAG: dienelactone hydrolase family protein [Myxococcota bacterium]
MLARRGAEIEYRSGKSFISAYVATPHSGTGPGVLVVHDAWGLNDFARDVCDRLARADFVALAPDLLHGQQANAAAAADRQVKELDIGEALAILDGAVVELFNQHGTDGKRVGALGFAMGGQLALALAGQNARVGAVADFYGWHPDVKPDFDTLAAPVLAIFSGEDTEPEATFAERLEANLTAAGVRCSVQTRNGVRAGFMDDSRPDVHDAVAEFECWDALLAFFRAELP